MTLPERYDYAFDPEGDSLPAKVVRRVPAGARVLELGTGPGAMTRVLAERGCRVTGIERDETLAARARPHCERMIVGDLLALDWSATLGAERFERILACDVLEHLDTPESVLAALPPFLAPEGRLLLTLPNLAHYGVVAALLQESFDYADKGLLDRTHERFYTRHSLERLLLATGWIPLQWEANRVDVGATEFARHWYDLPESLRQTLQRHAAELDVYQWLVVAVPANETGWQDRAATEIAALHERLESARREHEALQRSFDEHLASLKEHQKAFAEARAWIADLQREIDELTRERDHYRSLYRGVALTPFWRRLVASLHRRCGELLERWNEGR